MRRPIVAIIACLLLPCIAVSSVESLTPPQIAKHMHDEVERYNSILNDWQSQAHQQTVLTLAIGIIGLLVGVLQTLRKNWVKGVTVALGFTVSALTLVTKTVYSTDSRTLQRAVTDARPCIRDLQHILDLLEHDQDPANQQEMWIEFIRKSDDIEQIARKLLGEEVKEVRSISKSALLGVRTVYAQSSQGPPSWVGVPLQTDKTGIYFVGAGIDPALAMARTASYDDAVERAARWLKGDQVDSKSKLSKQLLDLVKNSSDVADTWFNQVGKRYVYCTRLRLPLKFSTLDQAAFAGETYQLELRSVQPVGDVGRAKAWQLRYVVKGPKDNTLFDHDFVLRDTDRRSFSPPNLADHFLAPLVTIPASEMVKIEATVERDSKVTARGIAEVKPELEVPIPVHAIGAKGSFVFEFVVKRQ